MGKPDWCRYFTGDIAFISTTIWKTWLSRSPRLEKTVTIGISATSILATVRDQRLAGIRGNGLHPDDHEKPGVTATTIEFMVQCAQAFRYNRVSENKGHQLEKD